MPVGPGLSGERAGEGPDVRSTPPVARQIGLTAWGTAQIPPLPSVGPMDLNPHV